MRRLFLGVVSAALLWSVVLLAQGPLTPIMRLRGVTDSAGSLFVTSAAATGSAGPLTPIGNLKGTTDSNGYLFVTMGAGSSVTPDTLCVDATNHDTCLGRGGASGLLNLTSASGSIGPQFSSGAALPTVTACGTGTVTLHSTNTAGEVLATGATACTLTFSATGTFTNKPFCSVTDETTAAALRISAISTASFTVANLTSGDTFMYVCIGGK
jgi:hypothetical protein